MTLYDVVTYLTFDDKRLSLAKSTCNYYSALGGEYNSSCLDH